MFFFFSYPKRSFYGNYRQTWTNKQRWTRLDNITQDWYIIADKHQECDVNIFILGIIYPKIMCPNCVHTKLSCSALYSEIFLYFIYQYVKYHISTIHILNKCVHKLVSIYLDQSLYQTFVGIRHERLLSIYLFSIPGLSLTVWKILLA